MSIWRLFGYTLVVCGVLALLLSLYSSLLFYYAQERILFFIPSLAQQVSFEELSNQPKRFDEKWIRVRGELRKRGEKDAILVPPGFRLETSSEKEDNHTQHFFIHNFSVRGITSLNTLNAPQNQPVTIVGEFEASSRRIAPLMGFAPHIDAVAVINPRQNELWSPMIRKSLSYAVTWLLSTFLAFLGWRILRFTQLGKGSATGQIGQTQTGNMI